MCSVRTPPSAADNPVQGNSGVPTAADRERRGRRRGEGGHRSEMADLKGPALQGGGEQLQVCLCMCICVCIVC